MKEFKLENAPKIEPGFKVPEHYFEKFSERLMHQLPEKQTPVISIFQKNKKIFMLVAAVFVIALFVPLFYTNTTAAKSTEIDTTTLENYLSYQSTINQYDLLNNLEAAEIDNINTTVVLEDTTIEDILVSNGNLEHLIIE